jgi:hypothetical protein
VELLTGIMLMKGGDHTQIHIEGRHEDRIAIRLEAGEARVDALLTRETKSWNLRYVDPHGTGHEVELSLRRMPWQTALRIALKYCEERLSAWSGKPGPGE